MLYAYMQISDIPLSGQMLAPSAPRLISIHNIAYGQSSDRKPSRLYCRALVGALREVE